MAEFHQKTPIIVESVQLRNGDLLIAKKPLTFAVRYHIEDKTYWGNNCKKTIPNLSFAAIESSYQEVENFVHTWLGAIWNLYVEGRIDHDDKSSFEWEDEIASTFTKIERRKIKKPLIFCRKDVSIRNKG